MAKFLHEVVTELFGKECIIELKLSMGGEDFPHHHPRFDFDEEALDHGVNIFVHAAIKFLG